MSEVIRIETKRTAELHKDGLEMVPNYKLRHVHIFLAGIRYREYHFHNDIEILAVIKGSAIVKKEKTEIKVSAGSVLLFNPSEPHEIIGDGEVVVQVIQFSKNFLQQYFPRLYDTVFETTEICTVLSKEVINLLWYRIIYAGLSYIRSEEYFELDTLEQLCGILQLLLKNVPNRIVSESDYLAKKKIMQRMERLVTYIDENYQYQIRLKDAATEEGITPTHLSHFFTENFGMSFQQYINNIRYEHAIRLMENTRMSSSEIAVASGFSDLKYMTRIFQKRHGMKPKEYMETVCRKKKDDRESAIPNIQREISIEDSIHLLEEFRKGLEEAKQ